MRKNIRFEEIQLAQGCIRVKTQDSRQKLDYEKRQTVLKQFKCHQ